MMLKPDLFDFAFVPDWYGQLNELREMALPEPWRFKKPMNETKNQDTPILERYLHIISASNALSLIFIQQGILKNRLSSFMWRMSAHVSILDFTTAGIKGFMPSLNGTTRRIPCWTGISGGSVMSCHRG